MKSVMEGSMAAAIAAKQGRPLVVPMYPITPQTHVSEYLAQFKADGYLGAETIEVESEHSAMSAAIGAQATGVRAFTATSSQGLALMHEMLHVAAGLRLPIVMVVVNRSLSAPINIWNDHQDSISQRDTGWIQLYAERGQDIYDTTLQARKIAEKALLPVMVCLDGFILSHMHEPVDILNQKQADSFIGAYKPFVELNPKKPVSVGPISFPDTFMEFKQAQHEAMGDAKDAIVACNSEFAQKFGRGYGDGLIETHKLAGAKHAVLAIGSVCGTIRHVIEDEQNVGLIKIRSFRPFPNDELRALASKLDSIAVIDKDISFGNHGALYTEVCAALRGIDVKVSGFIAGLGGRDIRPAHIEKAIKLSKEKEQSEVWLN